MPTVSTSFLLEFGWRIQIIDDGNDIIFKEKPLPDFNSRDAVEAWLDEGLEELWADMPEDVIRKYQEVIRRFENDESDN